jgi:hypothetical protein
MFKRKHSPNPAARCLSGTLKREKINELSAFYVKSSNNNKNSLSSNLSKWKKSCRSIIFFYVQI